MEVNQYMIVLVNLDPTIGSEIRKTRPCVIISPDEMNRSLRTLVIAPMTSTSKAYPTRIKISRQNMQGYLALDQIRTIDRRRIVRVMGSLSAGEIRDLKSIIRETFVD